MIKISKIFGDFVPREFSFGQGLLQTSRHFENRRGEGPGDEVGSGIIGLGSRLYPGNMQSIFNKDLTRFMQSLSRERQNRASKRKALLAG